MNWLSSDEDLISIRPKPEEDRKVTMTQSLRFRLGSAKQPISPARRLFYLQDYPCGWRRRYWRDRGLAYSTLPREIFKDEKRDN